MLKLASRHQNLGEKQNPDSLSQLLEGLNIIDAFP
jgi:hypothetical protein